MSTKKANMFGYDMWTPNLLEKQKLQYYYNILMFHICACAI